MSDPTLEDLQELARKTEMQLHELNRSRELLVRDASPHMSKDYFTQLKGHIATIDKKIEDVRKKLEKLRTNIKRRKGMSKPQRNLPRKRRF